MSELMTERMTEGQKGMSDVVYDKGANKLVTFCLFAFIHFAL